MGEVRRIKWKNHVRAEKEKKMEMNEKGIKGGNEKLTERRKKKTDQRIEKIEKNEGKKTRRE